MGQGKSHHGEATDEGGPREPGKGTADAVAVAVDRQSDRGEREQRADEERDGRGTEADHVRPERRPDPCADLAPVLDTDGPHDESEQREGQRHVEGGQ